MKLYTEEQVREILMSINTFRHISDSYIDDIIDSLTLIKLPSDKEILKWWQTQKFQKEQGEQEYTMLYEIDLPKILKAFIEHFSKIQGGNK